MKARSVRRYRTNSHFCRICKWSVVVAILLLGLSLRLYRLGDNLFWFDEIGVAVGAEKPSLREALEISQQYIMSMPLDYVIAWSVARISQAEGILRLPSAIWGTLTLLVAYFLYRELSNEQTARLGLILLTLTPIHIRYSQELKFYASLVFFYTLATYVALLAVKKKEPRLWFAFIGITMIGILFQVYTALVLVSLTLWVILTINKTQADHRLLKLFTVSASVISIFTLIAILLFGKSPSYQVSLFRFESLSQVILGGLGWMPLFPATGIDHVFGGLSLVFALIGLAISLSKRSDHFNFAIPISIFLQVLIIFGLNLMKGYFAYSRQLLILVPLVILITAIGIEKTISHFTKSLQRPLRAYYAGLFLAFSIFLVAAVPVLSHYYRIKKVDMLAVITWLSANWEDGQLVCIDPAHELFAYAFYLNRWGTTKDPGGQFTGVVNSLIPVDLHSHPNDLPDADYLITIVPDDQQEAFLRSEGFQLVYISPPDIIQPQTIWRKVEKP